MSVFFFFRYFVDIHVCNHKISQMSSTFWRLSDVFGSSAYGKIQNNAFLNLILNDLIKFFLKKFCSKTSKFSLSTVAFDNIVYCVFPWNSLKFVFIFLWHQKSLRRVNSLFVNTCHDFRFEVDSYLYNYEFSFSSSKNIITVYLGLNFGCSRDEF